MRLRLDSDVAVRISDDFGGESPANMADVGVTRTWFNAREWDGKSAKQKRALIKRIRKTEAALPSMAAPRG